MDLTEIRNLIMSKTGNHNTDEVDDAIRFVQRSYIQPVARLNRTIEYAIDSESVNISDIAGDIYKINHIYSHYKTIPQLNINDIDRRGVRQDGPVLHFQQLPKGIAINIHYQAKLKEIGPSNAIPEIDEDYHDLYWLGGIAMLDMDRLPLFLDRLSMFKRDMRRKDRPSGWIARVTPWC